MKQFFISKNFANRVDFVNNIKGKRIAIYNEESELLSHFDLSIDMNKLMKDDYYLENLAKCDGNTTLVLIDVLTKHGMYVHPYGRIFAFTEVAKATLIIDTFAFKWDEKQIIRPFLFINPDILGSSMINFFEGKDNTVENYYKRIKKYIQFDVSPINIKVINFTPTEQEITKYEALKEELIMKKKLTKPQIINQLIKYVDGLDSKKCIKITPVKGEVLITSNKPKNKFVIYNTLKNESIHTIYFLSSGIFGADEIELSKTKLAIDRHNKLIELINGN